MRKQKQAASGHRAAGVTASKTSRVRSHTSTRWRQISRKAVGNGMFVEKLRVDEGEDDQGTLGAACGNAGDPLMNLPGLRQKGTSRML